MSRKWIKGYYMFPEIIGKIKFVMGNNFTGCNFGQQGPGCFITPGSNTIAIIYVCNQNPDKLENFMVKT